jgi:hypothetical protein
MAAPGYRQAAENLMRPRNLLIAAIALRLAFDTVSAQITAEQATFDAEYAVLDAYWQAVGEAAAAYADAATANDKCESRYVPNPDLAYNQVQGSSTCIFADCSKQSATSNGELCVYSEKPAKRPANVPADYILVELWIDMPPFGLSREGWQYLDADMVKRLHRPPRI